jgi:Flp pilus assembly protein TadB
MTAIIEILRGLYGLFVDDELLAIGVLCVVALAALLIKIVGMEPLAAGAGLLCGNLLVLIIGAMRTARRTGRS